MERPLRDALRFLFGNAYLQIKQPKSVAIPFLRGKPGAGKTYSITETCNKSGWGFLSTHFAVKPIEETGGIPQFKPIKINDKEAIGTVWSIPDIIVTLYDLCSKHEYNIWLLDDSHLLSPMHMTLMYELLTERSIRGYKLPDNLALCLAGNTSNKAGAKTLFSAIVNRVIFIDIYTPFNHWKEDFAVPNNINPTVVSFLQYETNSRYFHEEEKTDKPWGSPRSWTNLANMIDGLLSLKYELTSQDILYLAQGHIGDGASEFTTYWEIYSKFNFGQILNQVNSNQFNISKLSGYEQYVLTMGLTKYYINKVCSKTDNNNLQQSPKKYYHNTFAKFLIMLLNEYEDLSLLSLRECWIHEKELKKRFMQTLFDEIFKLDKQVVPNLRKFIKEVQEGE
jgi:hypothetical protein